MTAMPADESIRVTATPRDRELDRDLKVADALARSLDTQFSIAGFRFGWDAFLGFVPVIGDGASAVLSLYPVYLAGRHDLGGWTVFRMLGNVVLDFLIGLIPVLGDFFDITFKANRRNLELFRKAVGKRRGVKLPRGGAVIDAD